MVKWLEDLPVNVRHVTRTGLAIPAEDPDIWEWARVNSYLIITNDEDFYRLAGSYGFPPKLVMLRTGNQSTTYLASLLRQKLDVIVQLVESHTEGVLELY